MNRQILHIALPSIVSNIIVPLLGLMDLAIAGHLGATAFIGAVSVGATMFNLTYWNFNFLRMGTSGMTAQAYGAGDFGEAFRILLRSTMLAVTIGLAIMALQYPLRWLLLYAISPGEEVYQYVLTYFGICIWGAPAILSTLGISGWFLGMQNSRYPMVVAITQNLVNIAASLSLVVLGGMKVEGVALGTLVAQYAGFLMGICLWLRFYGRLRKHIRWAGVWRREAMCRFFQVNRDIFLRTLCLVAVTLFFTSAGASQGEVVLAVNTLLMQLFTLYSYVMDGFAYAGEALSGRYIGAHNRQALSDTVRRLFLWGAVMALLFTLTYAVGGHAFLGLLTDNREVIAASDEYVWWALAIPMAGMAAFIWDGVFIGATATRGMLLSMAVAAGLFFLLYYGFRPLWGNHALWLAFLCYLFVRGTVQTGLAYRAWRNNVLQLPNGE